MYFYLEAQKARARSELRVITGASAGSANAFISAMSSCLPTNPNPMEDPGWIVWGPIGFDQLFDRQRATDEALFVSTPIEESVERMRLIWDRGLPEKCDVVVGVTVTRVKPRMLRLQEGLTVPRTLETFVVRIQGLGMGKAPRLTNYVDPQGLVAAPLLAFVPSEGANAAKKNFLQLRSLVLASGAFPLAFRPQAIEYCLSKPAKSGKAADFTCTVPDFSEFFVDGGVFDNNPLHLAWNIADHQLKRTPDGRFVWASPKAVTEDAEQLAVRYLYLDPDTTVFPPERAITVEGAPETGFLSRVLSLGGDMVDSAQARELGQLVNEHADLSERLHLGRSNLPKASEHLFNFIGFFEKDFRLFDFYLGMYDALVELRNTAAWESTQLDFEALRKGNEAARRGWAPFMCLLSMTEPDFVRYRPQCDEDELQNFRIMLQVSLDRLHERCRPTQKTPHPSATRPHFRCEQASTGAAAPLVPGVKALPALERQQGGDETGFGHFMRLLGAYGFEFKDLGLTREQSNEGRMAIRQRLDAVMDEWANAQGSFTSRFLAKSSARLALHEVQFSPPLFSAYAAVGTTLQAGASVVPFFWKPRWLQLTAALDFGLIETLATSPRPRLSMSLTGGPEFHLSPISSNIVQPRIAVRGGIQFSVFDGIDIIACMGDGDARDCTQGVLQLVFAVTLLERIRLHLDWVTFPALYGKTQAFFHLQFGIGFQFL